MRIAIIGVALLLSACGHMSTPPPEQILTPIEVYKPVTIGCVPANIAEGPEYPDTDAALKAATDAAERYQLLYAGRKVRSARLAELEPVISGCPKAPAQ